MRARSMFGPRGECSVVFRRVPQGQRYFRAIADHGGVQELIGHLVLVPPTAPPRADLVPGTLCWSWDGPVPAAIRLVQAHPARAPLDAQRVWHSVPILDHLPSDEHGAPLMLERCFDGKANTAVAVNGVALRGDVPGALSLPVGVLDFPWGGFLRVVDLERAARQPKSDLAARTVEAA